ncbi:MAG: tetratricopeptide repeat protein [Spirochaetes bacterium]|nr:MAG: tetratricopeptide repeat protein [Spirochaetota bacterium]
MYRLTFIRRASGAYALVLAALLLFTAWLDPLRDAVREGNERYAEKDYEGALRSYGDARGYAPAAKLPLLDFNEGDARYMSGDYEAALERFRGAAAPGEDAPRAHSYFNMGNAYYKKGDSARAIDSYVEALKADPDFLPAKRNLEFLAREEHKKNKGDKGQGEKGEGGADALEGQRERDRGRGDAGDGSKTGPGALDRDQVENILKSMRDRPVRRERGKDSGGEHNEKPW